MSENKKNQLTFLKNYKEITTHQKLYLCLN